MPQLHKYLIVSCHILKKLITILLLTLTTASYSQVNDENSFFGGNYDKGYIKRNKIKAVTINASVDSNRLQTRIFYFTKTGILEKENVIDSNGKETTIFDFKFNNHGDLIRRITEPVKTYRGDTLYYNKVYKGNQLIKESSTWFPIIIEHTYNSKGQRIQTVNPYNSGRMPLDRRVVRNEYDSVGRLFHVTDCVFRSDTDTIEMWMSDRIIVYADNKIQRVIEKVANGSIPNNRGNLEYSYDGVGNILSIVSDTVASCFYTYNNRGLMISKRTKMPEDLDELKQTRIIDNYSYIFWQ
jgi:hypothetical protein